MENTNTSGTVQRITTTLGLDRDRTLNMIGVILFYVIVFVAVNVFSGGL